MKLNTWKKFVRTKSAVPLFSSKSWLLSTSFTNFDSENKYLWRRTSHFIVVTACLPRLRQSYVCGGVLISRLKGFSLGVCIYFASFFNFVLWSWSKSIEANKYPLTLSVLLVNRTIADTISPSNAVRVPLEHNISWSKIAVWYDCTHIKRCFNYESVTSAKGNQTIY